MSRPRLAPLLAGSLALGLGAGALEVGMRAAPRLGLSWSESLTWLALGAGLSAAFLCVAALGAWLVGWRARGLVFGALIALHAGLAWRFDLYLNEFARDPRVWGGLLAIGLGSLALGLALDRLLARTRLVLGASALAGLLGVILLVARHAPPARTAQPGPSVLLVTLDTTRADRLGAQTPRMSALANQGAEFTQAIATAPLTEPSHLAILSGQPPLQSGVVSNGTAIGEQPAMLPLALRAQGFSTAAFVSGFPLHGRYGWADYFDVYDDDFGTLPGLHRLSLVKAWDQLALPAHTLRERRGDHTVDRALGWLDQHADERSFLWLHLFDAHAPYEAPGHPFTDAPTDGEPLALPAHWPPPYRAITSIPWLTGAYDAEVHYADAQLGRLLDDLSSRGRLDDTIIVVVADHGESLTEHGYLFDHGDHLYDASLHVPMVMRWPGHIPAGLHLDCQVSSADVTPTLLGLLGISDDQARFGRDRAADLLAGRCVEDPVVSQTVAGRFVDPPPLDHSLRAGGYKLILHQDGQRECYDLKADPGETVDVSCPAAMSTLLDSALQGGRTAASPELDPQTQGALQALGYIE